MTNNSEVSIDELIKRIYKSYVDIKVGEFREIDRDLLLSDIGLLYTSIKQLYPSHSLSEIELDLSINANNSLESIDLQLVEPEDSIRSISEPVIHISPVTALEKTPDITTKAESDKDILSEPIDLSLFEEDSNIETISNLQDVKSDNTASPILSGFKSRKEEPSKFEEFQKIPLVDNSKVEDVTPNGEDKNALEPLKVTPKIDETALEKKNSGKIIDFLHHEEQLEKKDIFQLLDINTRIGLVELFFKGNSMEFTDCLIKLNKQITKEDSLNILNKYAEQFGVSKEEDIYTQFVNLIDRKLNYQ